MVPESYGKRSGVREMFSPPDGEKIVSMINFEDRIFFATEYKIYEIISDDSYQLHTDFK